MAQPSLALGQNPPPRPATPIPSTPIPSKGTPVGINSLGGMGIPPSTPTQSGSAVDLTLSGDSVIARAEAATKAIFEHYIEEKLNSHYVRLESALTVQKKEIQTLQEQFRQELLADFEPIARTRSVDRVNRPQKGMLRIRAEENNSHSGAIGGGPQAGGGEARPAVQESEAPLDFGPFVRSWIIQPMRKILAVAGLIMFIVGSICFLISLARCGRNLCITRNTAQVMASPAVQHVILSVILIGVGNRLKDGKPPSDDAMGGLFWGIFPFIRLGGNG